MTEMEDKPMKYEILFDPKVGTRLWVNDREIQDVHDLRVDYTYHEIPMITVR